MSNEVNHTTGPWDVFYDHRSRTWRAWKLDGTSTGEASDDFAKVKRDVELRNRVAELTCSRERSA